MSFRPNDHQGLMMSKVSIGFAAALCSLVAIGGLFISSLTSKVDLSDLSIQSYDTIRQLDDLLSHLSDAESAALEYSLAGKRHYLGKYEVCLSALRNDLSMLREKLIYDSDQSRRLRLVDSSIEKKLELLEQLVQLNHSPPLSLNHMAQEDQLVDLGRSAMDHARIAIEVMQDSVDVVLNLRLQEMERARAETSGWLLVVTLLTFGIVGWLFLAVYRETLQRVNAQESLIEANAHLESRIQDRTRELSFSHDRLMILSRQVIQVQEQERRRIARDMHDEIGHSMTALKLELREIKDEVEGTAVATSVGKCINILDPILQQVRRVALELRPSLLDELGLHEASKWYVMQFARRAGLTIRFDGAHQSRRFSEDVEITAFRVLQEALNNVVKHAHATAVTVTMKQMADLLEIKVHDDGVGFSHAEARACALKGESIGLSCMEERVRLVGGNLKVVSSPGSGTEITANFPIESLDLKPQSLQGSGT